MAKCYYDTHVHTDESSACGKIPGRQAARLYKAAGYHGIVVTDHYTRKYFRSCAGRTWDEKLDSFLAGYREARAEGDKIGLRFFRAELALQHPYNDFLLMGIQRVFSGNTRNYTAKLRDLTDWRKSMVFWSIKPILSGRVFHRVIRLSSTGSRYLTVTPAMIPITKSPVGLQNKTV